MNARQFRQMKVFAIVVVTFSMTHYAAADESTAASESPDPASAPLPVLPPETFYDFFKSKTENYVILDASRGWDTASQLEHFYFLRDKIQDPKTDQQTKEYAQSILDLATERMKSSFEEAGFKIDYDIIDFIREMRNVEGGENAIHQDLYDIIYKYILSD